MVQCFCKKEYAPPFGLTHLPRLFSCSRTDAEASAHPRVLHAHDALVEIVLVREGESHYTVGGTTYPARRGMLFLYNSGVPHDEWSGPSQPLVSDSLALGELQVPGLRENAIVPDDAPPAYELTEEQTVRLERHYALLFDELTAGNEDGAHHLLYALLTVVEQAISAPRALIGPAENVLAARVQNQIDTHFTEPFSLAALAAACGASPYYIAHVFKDATGYSPLQYLLRRRIGEAQTLLITTGLPVTEIALRVGYDTASHFNAQFQKAVGLSPRAFRRAYVVTPGK